MSLSCSGIQFSTNAFSLKIHAQHQYASSLCLWMILSGCYQDLKSVGIHLHVGETNSNGAMLCVHNSADVINKPKKKKTKQKTYVSYAESRDKRNKNEIKEHKVEKKD